MTDSLSLKHWTKWPHDVPYSHDEHDSMKSSHHDLLWVIWRIQQYIVGVFADCDCIMSTQRPVCEQPDWFWGFLSLWFIWVYLVFTFLLVFVFFFWPLPPSAAREAKPGNSDSLETQWRGCKYKPEDSTQSLWCWLHRTTASQKGLFWTSQAKWSRAQVREFKLCFLALCETPRLLRSDRHSVVSPSHSRRSQMIG